MRDGRGSILRRAVGAAAVLIAAQGMNAGVWYVDQATGSDGNRGTRREPFQSLARALSAMAPGDSCLVGNGLYRESLVLTSGMSVLAIPGARPVLTGTTNLEVVWNAHRGHVYVTDIASVFGTIDRVNNQVFVDGEALREPGRPDTTAMPQVPGLPDAPGEYSLDTAKKQLYVYLPEGDSPQNHRIDLRSAPVVLSADHVSGITLKGIAIYGSGVVFRNVSRLCLEDCSIRYAAYLRGPAGPGAPASVRQSVTITGEDVVVRRCEVGGTSCGGIRAGGKNIVLTDNIVHDCGAPGAGCAGMSIAEGTEHAVLTFNTVYNCGTSPIICDPGVSDRQCIVEHNDLEGSSLRAEDTMRADTRGRQHTDGADWTVPSRAEIPGSGLPGIVLVNDHLRARIVDNATRVNAVDYSLLPGYNGLASLVSAGQERNIFAPAGLDYESCSTVPRMGKRSNVWNAPRVAPMTIERVDDGSVRLIQKGSEAAGLNVEIVFRLGESFVDQSITTWPDSDIQASSTFWASYLLFVQNTSLYLRGRLHNAAHTRWLEMTSAGHSGSGSGTYFRPCEPAGKAWYEFLTDNPVRRQAVFETPASRAATGQAGFAPGSLDSFENFFFGFVDNYVALWIFRPTHSGRFTTWISASGAQSLRRPAADFGIDSGPQKAGERRRFYVRLVYKPYAGLDDVLKEVALFQSVPGD